MNYGAEPADQVVRYTLEGTEFALKISGTAAKNFAVFALAVLRDQKKTHGKTKLVRLLREGKPLKFFSVPTDQMRILPRPQNRMGFCMCPSVTVLTPITSRSPSGPRTPPRSIVSLTSCSLMWWIPAKPSW